MFPRLMERLKQKDVRRHIAWIMAGKVLGIVVLLLAIKVIGTYVFHPAFADDAAADSASRSPYVNPINTMWMLVTAFLVFFMQAGFMFLEAGFARTRETVNVLLEGIVDTCLCGILFYAWGFAFMFGHGNGFIGAPVDLLPPGHPRTPTRATGVAFLAFFLFQFAFADTCSTITSGAMVGRTGFFGDLLVQLRRQRFHLSDLRSLGLGSGRLAQRRSSPRRSTTSRVRRSFTPSAASSPSPAAIVLGPRIGRKFKRDGGGPMPGHDMTIAAVGGVILWFGWYGFNPGSTLSAMDLQGCGRVAANTTLAACAGGLAALLLHVSAQQDLGLRHDGQRLPGRPRRDHLPLLLGVADRRDHPRRRSPESSASSRST